MPVVAAVIGFIAEATGITAAVSAAVTSIVGAGIVADVATGAIIGAGSGAIGAVATGQKDIGKAALSGAISGGVAGGISDIATKALGGGPAGGPGESAVAPSIAGSPTAALGIIKGTSGFSGSLAGALAGGQPFDKALQGAIRSGGLNALGGIAQGIGQYDLGLSSKDAGSLGQGASQVAGYLTQPTPSSPSYSSPQPSLNLQGRPSAVSGTSPSLAQSLSIAPSLGYTPTGSVFGSSDAEGKKSNVWNVGSLRNIGSAEA